MNTSQTPESSTHSRPRDTLARKDAAHNTRAQLYVRRNEWLTAEPTKRPPPNAEGTQLVRTTWSIALSGVVRKGTDRRTPSAPTSSLSSLRRWGDRGPNAKHARVRLIFERAWWRIHRLRLRIHTTCMHMRLLYLFGTHKLSKHIYMLRYYVACMLWCARLCSELRTPQHTAVLTTVRACKPTHEHKQSRSLYNTMHTNTLCLHTWPPIQNHSFCVPVHVRYRKCDETIARREHACICTARVECWVCLCFCLCLSGNAWAWVRRGSEGHSSRNRTVLRQCFW